jgi:hypothetical protein
VEFVLNSRLQSQDSPCGICVEQTRLQSQDSPCGICVEQTRFQCQDSPCGIYVEQRPGFSARIVHVEFVLNRGPVSVPG